MAAVLPHSLTTLMLGALVTKDPVPPRSAWPRLERQALNALQHSDDAIALSDARGCVSWLNLRAQAVTGWTLAEALGRPLDDVMPVFSAPGNATPLQPVRHAIARGQPQVLPGAPFLRSRDHVLLAISGHASPWPAANGRSAGCLLTLQVRAFASDRVAGFDAVDTGDLSAANAATDLPGEPAQAVLSRLRELRERVRHLLRHDLLTGAFNRREFDRRLKRALRRHQVAEGDTPAEALLFINLDEFKLVNDACGHVAGDRVLQQIYTLIGAGLRQGDTLARLGGDEFGVILSPCTSSHARSIAQGIRDRLDAHRHVHSHPERDVHHSQRLRIGASIGVVPIVAGWPDADVMLQAAEGACQQAKETGRNRVTVWQPHDPHQRGHDNAVSWAARINEAIDAGGFVLHAQCITPIGTGVQPGSPHHLEVLLRKRRRTADGNYGDEILSPSLFMPAVERFHMASRVDRWVLGETLAVLGRHLDAVARIEFVSINLSGQSLSDPDFLAWALAQIDASPVDPTRLCFEVTETAAITQMTEAIAFAQAMRMRGVRIALDDFGAGASSYGYLRALPVDLLKIDGQYVQGLEDDALKNAAVTSFCSVARAVGVRTVAEWVETEQTLATLRTLGVDYAQGHLLHRAEPLTGLLQRLSGD